jgi:methylase of polypeptide subunit release factors
MIEDINCSQHLKYYKDPLIHIKTKIKLSRYVEQYLPVDPKEDKYFYRNDWASIAFRAFLILKNKYKLNVDSFCSIGTGIGLDAICAIEAFGVKEVLITDLQENIALHARDNIKKNLIKENKYKITPFKSDIFKRENGFPKNKFDLIFENLPNLPLNYNDSAYLPSIFASFTPLENYDDVPQLYKKNLLFSHYKFLKEAKKYLSRDGGVLCNIGGRIPSEIIINMFNDLNYRPEIIVFDVRRQTEAESNINAYAKWEKENNINFKYYPFDILDKISKLEYYDKLSGCASHYFKKEIQEIMKNYAFSANEALKLHQNNINVAHEVFSIYAKVIN